MLSLLDVQECSAAPLLTLGGIKRIDIADIIDIRACFPAPDWPRPAGLLKKQDVCCVNQTLQKGLHQHFYT